MSVCGIIAEYNPFHNGHYYHLKKAKDLTGSENIVVVMSGNYVQRGEPAICNKNIRTKMALLNGADLVIELPVYFATAGAEYFANAAITLLDKSQICDYLCFGSELGELPPLIQIANLFIHESDQFKKSLKHHLHKGLSYPAARENAMIETHQTDLNILSEPNNILAIEYIKALLKQNSKIIPITMKRALSHYHSDQVSGKMASATGIRKTLLTNDNPMALIRNVMPDNCRELLIDTNKTEPFHKHDHFSGILNYILRVSTKSKMKEIFNINEGLENRLFHVLEEEFSITDILDRLKTKRYPYTKLQRDLLHIVLNITKTDMDMFIQNGGPQYIRVLGFRSEKSHLLTELKKKSQLPLIMNLKNSKKGLSPLAFKMLEKEVQSTDLYYSALGLSRKFSYEYTQPLVII